MTQQDRLRNNFGRNIKGKLHGDKVWSKTDRMTRIFYENVDGIFPISEQNLSRETKTEKLKYLFQKYEVDISGFS